MEFQAGQKALKELSGVNGLIVGDWIKAHADEVISHNSKYGMQNSKDSQRLDTYYNKRHGAEKITKILELVNGQLLDGEALKSQQGKLGRSVSIAPCQVNSGRGAVVV